MQNAHTRKTAYMFFLYFTTDLQRKPNRTNGFFQNRTETELEKSEDLDTHKTRMNGLSCGEESMTIRSAVLIQYQRVTDGRTDVRPAYIYYVLQHS